MAVLRFTAAGLVPTPTTVQVRVTRALPGRLAAGAPTPSRDLTDDEVSACLAYFLVDLRGPRTTPCRAVVLSGERLAERHGLAPLLDRARRRQGLQRVTLHLGRGQRPALRRSPLRRHIDDVVVFLHDEGDLPDIAALSRSGLRLTVVLRLHEAVLARLPALTASLAALGPGRVVFTWPLAGEPPPHAARVAATLPGPVATLDAAGVTVDIKGLPPCTLGDLGARTARTRNRWYVDADHRGPDALLFFPDVFRFSKVDTCRFCAADSRCDGAPARWLASGRAGPLRPLDNTV